MPELPEVEVTRQAIAPKILDKTVTKVMVRQRQLRWPIPAQLNKKLSKQKLLAVERRAKYLLLRFGNGTLMIHLGMSGRLRISTTASPVQKHDHVDIVFNQQCCLRYHDPRRFGAILFYKDGSHPLLENLGSEPLSRAFNPSYLSKQLQNKQKVIKQCLMDNQIVVGVGNIYANEALFKAGIHPIRPAGSLGPEEVSNLCRAVKAILKTAITQGGTTLKDFYADNQKGYFQQTLNVYNRHLLPCRVCDTHIERTIIGQRASYFCKSCQPIGS